MSLSTWRAFAFVLILALIVLAAWGGHLLTADHFAHQRGFSGCDAGWKACRLALDPTKPATDSEDATDDPGPCGMGWNACWDANAEE